LGLIAELTLLIGVGLGRGLPLRPLQLLDQTRRLARHHDVPPVLVLVSRDGLAAAEAGIGASINVLHGGGQALGDGVQVCGDLAAYSRVSAIKLKIS
ncbi:MAG: hypothetical protein RB191_02630, partial [Terriglobia bacterium]|nr:hypothetical protein [Terriglobia bacterium]